MILWRISEHISLRGEGGLAAGGRWHSQGRAIVYTSETSTLAMLEVLVHLELDPFPASFQLMRIEAPDEVALEKWAGGNVRDQNVTRAWGDTWLQNGHTLLAKVPSIVAPHSFNWLINPAHPVANRLRVTGTSRWPWDQRLFK